MPRVHKLCLIAILIAPLAWVSEAVAEGTLSAAAEAHWRGFRQRFPHHIQTVALSKPDASGHRTLVISEPPPILPREGDLAADLRAVFGATLRSAGIRRHGLSLEGWVEDVVAVLEPAADPNDLRARLDHLHERLFSTSYKASEIPLPLPPIAPAKQRALAPPDPGVSAPELYRWLVQERAPLEPIGGGTRHDLAELLRGAGWSGVWRTAEAAPGLVLLVLAPDQPLNRRRAELRRFALDTDMILGALRLAPGAGSPRGAERIAIVGRERTTPVTEVPPLRAETVLLLAGTGTTELAQSFERKLALAGKLESGPLRGSD